LRLSRYWIEVPRSKGEEQPDGKRRKLMMKRKLLKYTNVVIAALILNQFLSGLFNKGIPYHVFEILHTISGILLFVGVVVHVALNWGWVKTTFLRR
jgi:uncharacterized membrane protein